MMCKSLINLIIFRYLKNSTFGRKTFVKLVLDKGSFRNSPKLLLGRLSKLKLETSFQTVSSRESKTSHSSKQNTARIEFAKNHLKKLFETEWNKLNKLFSIRMNPNSTGRTFVRQTSLTS